MILNDFDSARCSNANAVLRCLVTLKEPERSTEFCSPQVKEGDDYSDVGGGGGEKADDETLLRIAQHINRPD